MPFLDPQRALADRSDLRRAVPGDLPPAPGHLGKLLVRSALGLGFLALWSYSGLPGLSLGVNAFNAPHPWGCWGAGVGAAAVAEEFLRGAPGFAFVREGRVRGCQAACLVGRPLSKWGCTRTAPAKPALSGERDVFGRRSRSKHDLVFFPRLRAGKLCEACPTGRVGGAERWVGPFGSFLRAAARTCWVCPTGRVRWTEGGLDTLQGFPTPKAFPSGKVPQCAHWGRMRGDLVPTFSCRKGGLLTVASTAFFLLPRWATRSPPHPSPSVTASPRGSLWVCSPTRKSAPNQGTYMGYEIAPRPSRCAPPRQNERVGNERPLTQGGGGHPPRDSLRPGFLLEKAWIPRRDRAGTHVAGSTLRWFQRNHPPTTTPAAPDRGPQEGGPCHNESPSLRPDRAGPFGLGVCRRGGRRRFSAAVRGGDPSPRRPSPSRWPAWLGPEEAAAPAAAAPPPRRSPPRGGAPSRGSFSP